MKLAHTTTLGLWAAVAFGAAFALDLPDPTRPPNGMTAGGTAGANLPKPGPDATDPARGAQEPKHKVSTMRLSAVLLADAPGRHAAVIDGQVRHVGDRVSDGTVAGISAGGVTIKASGRTVQLSLYAREAEPTSVATSDPLPIDSPPSGASAPGKEQP